MIRFMARNIERCDDLFFQGFLGVTWSNSKKETAIQYVSTRSLFFIDLEGVDNSLRYQYRIYDLWLADRNSSHHRAMERIEIAVR